LNELELTLGWVAKTVGGTLQSGDPALPVGDVLTDSRSLRAGDLFVALKGPRFDGHAFVEEVLRARSGGSDCRGSRRS
jgi:UDP-N-acetylmuramyl pentapeptide synthase